MYYGPTLNLGLIKFTTNSMEIFCIIRRKKKKKKRTKKNFLHHPRPGNEFYLPLLQTEGTPGKKLVEHKLHGYVNTRDRSRRVEATHWMKNEA